MSLLSNDNNDQLRFTFGHIASERCIQTFQLEKIENSVLSFVKMRLKT